MCNTLHSQQKDTKSINTDHCIMSKELECTRKNYDLYSWCEINMK